MNAESMQALESGYYQLHRELAEANETIGNLRNDLTKAQARITELEAQLKSAQQWEPKKMADSLQGLGFVVVEPQEANELREEGGNCPCCWHQVQP